MSNYADDLFFNPMPNSIGHISKYTVRLVKSLLGASHFFAQVSSSRLNMLDANCKRAVSMHGKCLKHKLFSNVGVRKKLDKVFALFLSSYNII